MRSKFIIYVPRWRSIQWNFSITATIGKWNFGLYRGVALSQGWICINRAHLGHNEVSLIEGVSLRTSGVAFIRGLTVMGKWNWGGLLPSVYIQIVHPGVEYGYFHYQPLEHSRTCVASMMLSHLESDWKGRSQGGRHYVRAGLESKEVRRAWKESLFLCGCLGGPMEAQWRDL